MRRVLQFKQTDSSYGCYENDDVAFEIKKSDLQFNVKDFYQAFYAEDKDFDDIVVENTLSNDKDAMRVYNCIQTIIKQIGEKLTELAVEGDIEDSLYNENTEELNN